MIDWPYAYDKIMIKKRLRKSLNPPCRIQLNSIQLGENLAVLFRFDFYYTALPQRLELPQIYVFQFFLLFGIQYMSILPKLVTSTWCNLSFYIITLSLVNEVISFYFIYSPWLLVSLLPSHNQQSKIIGIYQIIHWK